MLLTTVLIFTETTKDSPLSVNLATDGFLPKG